MADIWPAVALLIVWTFVCVQATKAYVLQKQLRAEMNERDKWATDYLARNKGEE